ncbi:MAG: hypothetical protein EOP53_17555 [Sphingobacteriales bacterium]|nr:MAG: hypothetical protein EOP53_17555 [Sphingobacteriales bacterium]
MISRCILGSLIFFLFSCNNKSEQKEEQISVNNSSELEDTIANLNSVQGNVSFSQVATRPNYVLLTGQPDHRLVTIYKYKENKNYAANTYSSSSYSDYSYEDVEDRPRNFMPGIEVLYGYNMLNVAHYDLHTEKLNFLFKKPALIKTLYYPSLIQDSIDKVPITRNYYLVSVYDEDTNKDTLINKKDLRRFYHFNIDCSVKTQLIPNDYSVLRSQYDSKNDVMYLFAIHDDNRNGTGENKEQIHVFWINLKNPTVAKRMY